MRPIGADYALIELMRDRKPNLAMLYSIVMNAGYRLKIDWRKAAGTAGR